MFSLTRTFRYTLLRWSRSSHGHYTSEQKGNDGGEASLAAVGAACLKRCPELSFQSES